jgi:hypothetical protein
MRRGLKSVKLAHHSVPVDSPKASDAITRERLIEIYEAEIRQAFYDIGDDFDLCRDDIDFTDDGAVICGEVVLLPPGTIEMEHLVGYL